MSTRHKSEPWVDDTLLGFIEGLGDDAVVAVEMLKPKVVIPMHYDTFPPIKVDAEDFRAKVAAKGFTAEILRPGEQHTLQGE